jgi:hypothetical protein
VSRLRLALLFKPGIVITSVLCHVHLEAPSEEEMEHQEATA